MYLRFLLRSSLLLLVFLAGPAAAGCPRIISQSPYITLALEWLGQGPCIVGASRYDRRELPRTGGVMDPDGAAIAALHPDLILASTWTPAETLAATTPPGTRTLRVDGFASLDDAAAALAQIAVASEAPGGPGKVLQLLRDWRRALARIPGQGRRALVLSACGTPYSYGRETLIGDIFSRAGFTLVESAPHLRHIGPGQDIEDIGVLVGRFQPDIVFNLSTLNAQQCDAHLGQLPVRLIHLNGEHFVHPGPSLLQGLAELEEELAW